MLDDDVEDDLLWKSNYVQHPQHGGQECAQHIRIQHVGSVWRVFGRALRPNKQILDSF